VFKEKVSIPDELISDPAGNASAPTGFLFFLQLTAVETTIKKAAESKKTFRQPDERQFENRL
jgi:hypothetical protein